MREALAERLLAKVMNWSPEDVAEERPVLQALASYKYDRYQQFSAGMHFIESLAIWLSNFTDVEERRVAYRFVRERLIYISEGEMRHLVSLSYPDHIQNILLSKCADDLGMSDYLVTRVLNSDSFKKIKRKSLFLGLSDGARIDVFRRVAGLSNEQVCATYQISDEKACDMVQELRSDLAESGYDSSEQKFDTLFLMDDFSGSGDSLLREEDGKVKGKLARCLTTLLNRNDCTQLLDMSSLSIHLVLYVVTRRAFQALTHRIRHVWPSDFPSCSIEFLYIIEDSVMVTREKDPEFDMLLEKYYDNSVMDKHLQKGGGDVIHGYGGCSLPLVLAHNTPNNSVHLLWANRPGLRTKPLFPRVSRHREEI